MGRKIKLTFRFHEIATQARNDSMVIFAFFLVMLSLSKHLAVRRIACFFFATLDPSTSLRMTDWVGHPHPIGNIRDINFPLRISLDSKFLAYYNSNVANIYSLGGLSQPVVMPFSSGQVQQPQQPMR